jgi:Xaa-Pro dipeptidase
MRAAPLLLLVPGIALAHPPAGVPPVAPAGPPAPKAPVILGENSIHLDDLQKQIATARLDGWLLADFRGQDDLAIELVQPAGSPSRRWFHLIPPHGEPVTLAFKADAGDFERTPGKKLTYDSWRDLEPQLRALLKGRKRVAMSYSPRGALPSLSRVDAGLVELVRSFGVQVVPATDLITRAAAQWSEAQRATHYFAMHQILQAKDEAFRRLGASFANGKPMTEWDLAQSIARDLSARGLETELPPLVAAGAHTADPSYRAAARSATIKAGDVVLVEIAARQANVPGAVYAEATFAAFVGDAVPDKIAAAFAGVKAARDAAVALIQERLEKKQPVRGFEVDAAARAALEKAALGKMPHALGRSLEAHPFGDGPSLDDLETHDDRALPPHTGYVLSPAHYAQDFGVRTSVDVYLGDKGVEVTGEKGQEAIELIKAR